MPPAAIAIRRFAFATLLAVMTAGWATLRPAIADDRAAPVEFNRDIRPILSDNCFHCHGPDRAQRKADLRLDIEAEALAQRAGEPAIVPGNSAASEIVRRITSADPDERMPPEDSKRRLTAAQIEL